MPLYGNIAPFYGNIAPFYGNIAPFYGNIAPFYGNIAPFYGNIAPFWGNIAPFYGNIAPFYGNIAPFTDGSSGAGSGPVSDAFWGSGSSVPYNANGVSKTGIVFSQITPFWTGAAQNWSSVQSAWTAAQTPTDFSALANQIQSTILDPATAFWSAAIAKSGKGAPAASQAYIANLFTNAGIAFNADGSINAASLQGTTPTQQAILFLGLYDGYMGYTGAGRVDWWMGAANWSPALAQIEGTVPKNGTPPTIGMIDFAVSNGKHLSKQLTQYGSTVFSDGHGAAVASLIIGATDGSGVLGVLPRGAANVIVYDPYDATGTTNWTDVGTGLALLSSSVFNKGKGAPVGVLNASLGVPGWTLHPGWNGALANAGAAGHNLVIAAGNDGLAQTQNVPWDFTNNPSIIIVGSVGLNGQISNFSNQPGEACLLPTSSTSTACSETNKLKYRFIVAPGELILVSDGSGGFSRQSGTSLAAPLVSGTIAMLQNRWPWLANYPNETAQIVLKSATPLGTNPGADATYGVGMLNIKASQSPLNWSNVVYYAASNGQVVTGGAPVSPAMTQMRAGSQALWDAYNVSVNVFEPIGATYRDFQIPLASKLVGQTVQTAGGAQLYQSYLTSSLLAQAGRTPGPGGPGGSQDPGDDLALGFVRARTTAGDLAGMPLRISMAPRELDTGFQSRTTLYQMHAALGSARSGVEFGFGEGAVIVGGQSGLGFHSDYTLSQGGTNPLLGLASGGVYFNTNLAVASRLTVSIGGTQRSDTRNLALYGLSSIDGANVRTYQAQAARVGLRLAVSDAASVNAAMTSLHEDGAALGVQSLDPADLRGGATTTGLTMGFEAALPWNLSLSGSGTVGSTRLGQGQIQTRALGLVSTAGEIALSKANLFSTTDSLRFALSKPLHVASGQLHYDSVGVIDRQTGALGVVSQPFSPTVGKSPIVGEMIYGRSLSRGRGEFSLFGRATANAPAAGNSLDVTGGAQVNLAF